MELHTGKKNHMTCPEILLSIVVTALCSEGAAHTIPLCEGKRIVDPGSLYRESPAGAVLPSCPAWIETGRHIMSQLAPLYAVLIFLLPFGNTPTVLFQLLSGAGLAILAVRLNLFFSSPPVKKTRRGSLWKNTCMTI